MASKPKQITVLAFQGVNVVDEPFDLADGELVAAQNAERFKSQGRQSIRSRAGLVSIAALGLGSINGIAAVALLAPIIGTAANAKHRIYAAIANGWLKSLDAGATFSATVDLARTSSSPGALAGVATGTWSVYVGIKTSVQAGRQFFYVMTDSSQAVFVMGYDGADERPLARIGTNLVTAEPMFFGDGRVHLVVPQAVGSTVVSLEPVTGLPQRLFAALASPEVFTGGCYYQGRLFMITALRTAGARVLSARPADTAWTDENYGAGLSTPVTATVTIATAPGTTNVIPGIVGQTLHITSITTGPWALGEAGDYKDTTGTAVPGAVAITGTTLIQTFSGTGAALTADAGLDIVTTVHSTVGAHTTAVGYYLPTTPAPPESLTSIAHYAAVPAPTYNPRYLYMTSFVISGNATISQRDYFGVYRIVLTSPDTAGGATSPVFYSHLTRYGTDLYVIYTRVVAGAVTVCKVFKTSDGATWTQDYDLFTNGGHCITNVEVIGTDLYVTASANASLTASAAALFRRRAGSWTKVSTNASLGGPVGII
jgi:hypothetical protein